MPTLHRSLGRRFCTVLLIALTAITCSGQISKPANLGPFPGPARATINRGSFSLSNSSLKITWQIQDGIFRGDQFENLTLHQTLSYQRSPFIFLLADGRVVSASDMRITSQPSVTDLAVQGHASRRADSLPGKAVTVELEDGARTVHATWQAILRNDSDYIRQRVTLVANVASIAIAEIRLVDWELPEARVVGTVKGSPVVAGTVFVGFEHPLSECAVSLGRVRCKLVRTLPLRPSVPVTYSSVVGVTREGQVRRAFLRYLEQERAHPYRTFLHYNSWYDLAFGGKYDESAAVKVIDAFGTELTKKRGVELSSFLFDDGWDDTSRLWKFHSGFPDGFAKLRSAAAQYRAAPGIWLSPWGGYGKSREERVAAGQAAGYEVVGTGFALSGPKYYRLFRDTCLDMIHSFGVNQFKFDGTGNANRTFPGSEFDSDFDAAINVIQDLRAAQPDLYVNLTTGTFPSPFWLLYADSIWRGGADHSFAGAGTSRERWITYRDAATYENVVLGGPLYPLNSLMLHGVIYAKYAKDLDSDPNGDFKNEVRSYFGNGTQLQEMYVTASLLSSADWDNLAEAAKWSRDNAGVLVDTHWIGGDPSQLEIYGWASWAAGKGILVLRNPAEKSQTISVELGEAFELPNDAPRVYRLGSPWKEDRTQPAITLKVGDRHRFELKPFQVLVLEGPPLAKR